MWVDPKKAMNDIYLLMMLLQSQTLTVNMSLEEVEPATFANGVG